MPIEPVHGSTPPAALTSAGGAASRSQNQTPSVDVGSVSLSALDASGKDQDIAASRVRQVADGLARGSLKFDSGRIADAIIASARELLAQRDDDR